MTNEKRDELLNTLKNTTHNLSNCITKKRLKKALGLLLITGLVASGGMFALHQNKVQANAQERAAETQLLLKQAEQNKQQLLSTDEIKSLAATALEKDVKQITFREIYLDQKDNDDHYDKHDKHDKNDKHDRHNDQNDRQQQDNPSAVTSATPKAAKKASVASRVKANGAGSSYYVYKVKCQADNMRYKLVFNAQTGDILKTEVDKVLLP